MHQMKLLALATSCFGLLLAPIAARCEDVPKPVEAKRPSEAAPPAAPAAKPDEAAAKSAAAVPTAEPSSNAGNAAWNAEVAPSNSSDGITLDAHQKDLVDKISSYFSGINTLQGSFLQTGSDNRRMKGKFYLSRPGRFRFDYARPSRQIVISDGRYLAVQDLDLNNEDRVALDQTPFRLLLRTDVNLVRDARITELQESDDMLVLGLEDKDPNTTGRIKLYLATKPDLELKEWVTRDAQGLDTRVEVSDLAKSVQLDADLFTIKAVGKPMATP
jgi:outer membrane lipoprotein-sorting protein